MKIALPAAVSVALLMALPATAAETNENEGTITRSRTTEIEIHRQKGTEPVESQALTKDATSTHSTYQQRAMRTTGNESEMASIASRATLPAGVKMKADQESASEAIRDVLEAIANNAVGGDFGSITERFVDADRDRIQKVDFDLHEAIEDAGDRLHDIWEATFDRDFEINEEDRVYEGFTHILVGEIEDPAQLSWPVTPTRTGEDVQKTPAPGHGDVNLEKGRDVAVVVIPKSHGLPELNVSMIHEAIDAWKIDVPDNVDREKLETNVLNALKEISANVGMLPKGDGEAQRYVTHRVLMAIYDIPVPAKDNSLMNTDNNVPKTGTMQEKGKESRPALQEPVREQPISGTR